jgi:hypothetical protein
MERLAEAIQELIEMNFSAFRDVKDELSHLETKVERLCETQGVEIPEFVPQEYPEIDEPPKAEA